MPGLDDIGTLMEMLSNPDAIAEKVKEHTPQLLAAVLAQLGVAANVPTGQAFGVLLFTAPGANGTSTLMARVHALTPMLDTGDELASLNVADTVRAMPNAAIQQLIDQA